MGRLSWRSSLRVTALLVVAFWVAGSVLQVILSFDLTGAPPPEKPDFLDGVEAFWAWERSRWAMEFAANVLFALGFAAFAGMGVLLSRLATDPGDARRSLAAAAFVGTGVIGALGPLVWLGVKPVATSSHFCPCGFRAEEVTSRLIALGITESLTMWLTSGAIVLAAIGFVLIARLGAEAGMGRGWALYSYLTAAASLAAVVGATLQLEPYAYYSTVAIGGILLPLWALWVGIRAPQLAAPEDVLDGEPMEPALSD